MAGVAGPMARRDRAAAVRFLLGLGAGEIAAALVLVPLIFLAGTLARWGLPAPARTALLVVAGLVLGVADLRHRTPHVWRQVPQRLVGALPPATLGTAWGFDLGLLFTTQKTTSLIWVALLGVVLFAPAAAAPVLLSMALVSVAAIATLTWWAASRRDADVTGRRGHGWFLLARRASGAALVALAVLVAVHALPA